MAVDTEGIERGVSAVEQTEKAVGLKEATCSRHMQSDTGNIPLRKRAGGAFVQTGYKEYVKLKERKQRSHVNRGHKKHKR